MALSSYKKYQGVVQPLGFVSVATAGTPVCIMANVDANNNGSPSATTTYGGVIPESAQVCRAVTLQGYKPGAANNGMIINTGNVYVMLAAANNGSGNRTDSGAMVKVLYPGADYTIGGTAYSDTLFSPYQIFLDSDVNGEGALTTLLGVIP